MTQRQQELTTVDSWERLWNHQAPDPANSGTDRRFRTARSWHRLLAELLDSTGRAGVAQVLELGCAPGRMLLDLHRLRPQHHYHGLDYAPAGLDRARALLAAAGVPATLHLGDIRDAVVAPADLVLSFGLVEHFADPAEAIGYHRRFLAPGGTAAVTVPNYAHPLVVAILRRFSPETLATHNLTAMSPDRLREAFRRAGFTDVHAGECGGALLPNSRPRPGPLGRAYRLGSQGWNAAARLGPQGFPWSSVIWARGRTRSGE